MDADFQHRRTRPVAVVESEPALVDLIRREIAQSGPMPFARFMELALYAPELGYYTSPRARPGREGDFLTAPETHPIFGAALARGVAEVWRRLGEPGAFAIREYGAGSGALAESIIAALVTREPALASELRYEAVEINPYRRQELQSRLATPALHQPAAVLDPAVAASAAPRDGIVLANEFLDAFPVHRVEQTADGLREVFVDWGRTGFQEVIRPPSTPRLAERLAGEEIVLETGQRAEIALGLDDWLAEVAGWLRAGVVIVIDYGHAASELYGPRRQAGTLMGYVAHRAMDDPLVAVGRQDLTAHVDFTAVERAAQRLGLAPLGRTTQAGFLMGLGIEELLEQARSEPSLSLGEYLDLRSGLVRLLDSRHTGGFGVLVLSRGIDVSRPLLGMRPPGS